MTGIAVGSAALVGVAFGWWGIVAAVASMVAVSVLTRGRIPLAAIGVILSVAAVGAWRSMNESPLPAPASIPSILEQASVVSAPVQDGRYQRFVVETKSIDEPGQAAQICVVSGGIPEIHLGDVLELSGDVRASIDEPIGIRAFLEAQGCSGSLYAPWVSIVGSRPEYAGAIVDLRNRINAVLRASAPGDAGVLLSGLVTGDDAAFSRERQEAFRRTGTTHLTAVSGSNLALIAGMLASIGTATLGRHRIAWQVMTIAGVWAYAAISGAQPPAVRAAIVATAAILAFRFGRRPDFPTLILLAAGAMALVDPTQIDHLGFRLSVAASLALAVVLPSMIEHQGGTGAGSVLAAATAAQVATLPLLLPVFGTVSLVSVPANLLVAPLVALAMPIAVCAGLLGLVWPPLAAVVAAPAALLATATLGIVDMLGTPRASLQIGTPPMSATIALAVAAVGLLLALSGDVGRSLVRMIEMVRSEPVPAPQMELPAAPAAIFSGEDPTDALATNAHDPVENPACQEY